MQPPPSFPQSPVKASDPAFLDDLRALSPDLCITVAYGNFLPSKFLAIPRLGTLNIHPSLLPRWRGASPVPRTIEAGDPTCGVSVVYTELAMDAGPILAVHEEPMPMPSRPAPDLLSHLMTVGTELLIAELPAVLSGQKGVADAVPQAATGREVTHAAKMSREEGRLRFDRDPAVTIYRRMMAFAGWPGTTASFVVVPVEADASEEGGGGGGSKSSVEELTDVKILAAEVMDDTTVGGVEHVPPVEWVDAEETTDRLGLTGKWGVVRCEKDALVIPCGGGEARGGWLRVTEVQVPGKKPAGAGTVVNGLRGQDKRLIVKLRE